MSTAFNDILQNEPQTVLDLFCGAGGMSLGFQQAGYDVIAGVDYDETAIATYNHNFDHRGIHCDLTELQPEEFVVEYDIHRSEVDIVAGGPPCQAFSLAGKRDEDDPRANLVFRFVTYVDYYQPESFVMENVEGIESHNDGETIELLYKDFEAAGYTVDHRVLNAADYGVPQTRKRSIFIGKKNEQPQFPEPTHVPRSELNTTSTTGGVVADD